MYFRCLYANLLSMGLVLCMYNFVNARYLLECVRVLYSAGDLSRFVVIDVWRFIVIFGDCVSLM